MLLSVGSLALLSKLAIAVIALAYGWVRILDWLISRKTTAPRESSLPAKPALHAAGLARRNERRRSGTVQKALAMACACMMGRVLFADHWTWSALSAFLVLNGTLVRAEVLTRGVYRLVGAAAGTAGASMVAGVSAPNSPAKLAALLAISVVSIGLRPMGYAWWVAGLMAGLSLLYSYQGQDAAALLGACLMALGTGAVLAIAVAWFVLPVRGKPRPAGMR